MNFLDSIGGYRYDVESAPATVFLRDPGTKPLVVYGISPIFTVISYLHLPISYETVFLHHISSWLTSSCRCCKQFMVCGCHGR